MDQRVLISVVNGKKNGVPTGVNRFFVNRFFSLGPTPAHTCSIEKQ